jgi:hypothetical protein
MVPVLSLIDPVHTFQYFLRSILILSILGTSATNGSIVLASGDYMSIEQSVE